MLSFLPNRIQQKVNKYGLENLTELRIRKDQPIMVIFLNGDKSFLKEVLTKSDIEKIILTVCNNSIYSYDEQIKRGFITTDKGVRIGLSGEFVYENNTVLTIKNFQSLCVRIPRLISGLAKKFISNIYKGGNVLIISESGVGKTTYLRDLVFNLSENCNLNVVIIDERNEIACINGEKSFNLGKSVDVLTYSTKDYGFSQAIRTLNPDVIVADELTLVSDVLSLKRTVYGGTKVIATVHASSIENALSRDFMFPLKKSKIFDYYVLIKKSNGLRKYLYFDKDYNEICL